MKAQLIITIDDDESITVSGPIDNKLIAYGLLEAARDSIQSFHAQAAMQAALKARNGSGIVIPRMVTPRDIKGVG